MATNVFPIHNPYTGDLVGEVPSLDAGAVNEALEAAHRYRCPLDGPARARVLRDTAARIKTEADDFARLVVMETGLSLKNAHKEVRRAGDCLEQGAIEAEAVDQEDLTAPFLRGVQPGQPKLTVISEPYDLIVGITPFNHPLNMVAHKVVPAVAAGTAMVLKPSEKAPLSAYKLRDTLVACGLPEDMLRIVSRADPRSIVDQLVSCPGLDLVTFTGSLAIGRYIPRKMSASGNELKRYIAELGGNACFVVLEDADLKRAAEIATGAFENSGQRCTCGRKILVHNKVADEFLDRFRSAAAAIRFGDPMDPETDMGTVISEEQAILIEDRVNDSLARGAVLILGNQRAGALYAPTIIDKVQPDHEVANKETFGPLASVLRIDGVEDAVDRIRQGRYRLAAGVATTDLDKAAYLHNEIAVGQFSLNGPPGYRTEIAPFGGFGDSGNGEKEGIIMTTRAYRRIRTFYDHG